MTTDGGYVLSVKTVVVCCCILAVLIAATIFVFTNNFKYAVKLSAGITGLVWLTYLILSELHYSFSFPRYTALSRKNIVLHIMFFTCIRSPFCAIIKQKQDLQKYYISLSSLGLGIFFCQNFVDLSNYIFSLKVLGYMRYKT